MLRWQFINNLVPAKWLLRVKTFFSFLPFVSKPAPYLMTCREFINRHCQNKNAFAAPVNASQQLELFNLLESCPNNFAQQIVNQINDTQFSEFVATNVPTDKRSPVRFIQNRWYQYRRDITSLHVRKTIFLLLKPEQQTKIENDFITAAQLQQIRDARESKSYQLVQHTLSMTHVPLAGSASSIELSTFSKRKSLQEHISSLSNILSKVTDESKQVTALQHFFVELPRAQHVALINELLALACERGETIFLPACINILRGKITSYVNDDAQFKPAKEHFYLADFLANEKYMPPIHTEKDRDDLRSIIENINKTGFKIPPALHEKILLSLILLAEKLAIEDVRATLDKTPIMEIDRICKNWLMFINTYRSLTPGEKPSVILQNLIEQIKKHAVPDHSHRVLQWMNPLLQLHQFKDRDPGQIALEEQKKQQEFQKAVDAIDPTGAQSRRARAM